MRITVKAKSRSRKEKVEQLTQPTLALGSLPEPLVYKVSVREPSTDNRANDAIIRALAEHFSVAQHSVRMLSGHTAPRKIVEIDI